MPLLTLRGESVSGMYVISYTKSNNLGIRNGTMSIRYIVALQTPLTLPTYYLHRLQSDLTIDWCTIESMEVLIRKILTTM
jgi:hypothetical protein